MKIPIKQAIRSGECFSFISKRKRQKNNIILYLKFISFEKINLNEMKGFAFDEYIDFSIVYDFSEKKLEELNLFKNNIFLKKKDLKSSLQDLNFNKKEIKIVLDELEKINEPEEFRMDEGELWLLDIEVINRTKVQISSNDVKKTIVLLDEDDFIFKFYNNWNLNKSRHSKIRKFNINFIPKIKYTGAIPYLLPLNYDKDYYLSIEKGTIQKL